MPVNQASAVADNRYFIHARPAPAPAPPPGKWRIARGDECINCGRCVTACLYGVHEKDPIDVRLMAAPHSDLCRNCFRCVIECPVQTLSMTRSPEYRAMGRDVYTPDVLQRLWFQAETGRIPVSGGGYKGPFRGDGFDAMWTDMSEIVRPTRDGIHGREYISTSVDLGRKEMALSFVGMELAEEPPPNVHVPIPMMLELCAEPVHEAGRRAIADAARELQTLCLAGPIDASRLFGGDPDRVVVRVPADAGEVAQALAGSRHACIEEPSPEFIRGARERHPRDYLWARLALRPNLADRVVALVEAGVDIVLLAGDDRQLERGGDPPRHVRERLREIHQRLVRKWVRDRVTLLYSGGIAMAEHVPKAILCGVDAVVVDLPAWIALGCRACAAPCAACPPQPFEHSWAVQRVVNLIGGWRDQVLEILGAMGLREVRRLRGEAGRAMFAEDLDREFLRALESPQPMRAEPPPPPFAPPPVHAVPFSFKNGLGHWTVLRADSCVSCGLCVELCPYDVHVKPFGFRRVLPPKSAQCIGAECRQNDFYCIDKCPVDALGLEPGPLADTLGDPRWPSEMILSTWEQAEHGAPPRSGLEFRVGQSGGGFDALDFAFPLNPPDVPEDSISTDLELNRRPHGERIRIPVPWYGGGMSFGSIGITTMLSRARAAKAWNTFTCTGEGGYPEALRPYDPWIITQVATGLFGVREDTLQRVRIVEFKYAQGAKPGLGGHLLADKNTPVVARMREAVPQTSLFSPFPFHSVYSVEDHKKHVDWVRAVNPRALVAVKVSTPIDVDMVAVGSFYAGAHIIHIDGSYGGTGAAPEIAKKNIAMPIEYAIPRVHQYLVSEGVRDQVVLIASGGIRSAWDIAKAIALGADGVVLGTSDLVAINCVRCGNCESGRGCPVGIATTDPELCNLLEPDWGTQRIVNLYHAYRTELRRILRRLGLRSVRELTGRTDLLRLRGAGTEGAGS